MTTPAHDPTPRLRGERLEDRLNPGTGTFVNGEFNFAVSVRFPATEEQLVAIQVGFLNAGQAFYEATYGQHKFGDVTLVNNSMAGDDAEVWVFPGLDGANAPAPGFGVRGQHINLFFDTNFTARRGAGGDALTIVHEFGHHLYGILDEYKGPNDPAKFGTYNPALPTGAIVPAYNAPPALESPGLSYSLMDNYFVRGGRVGDLNSTTNPYTLRYFSVPANHDPQRVTLQSVYRQNKSDWEMILSSPYPATLPNPVPAPGSLPPHFVRFHRSGGAAATVAVLDRSGSMDATRLAAAQNGARLLTRYLAPTDGVGVVSFSDDALVNRGYAPGTPANTDQARTAIDGLVAQGGTNIGAGLQAALAQITALPEAARSPNEVILLLTDGDNTVGDDPVTLIPALKAAGVSVVAIGMGTDLSDAGKETLRRLAAETGGYYLQANSLLDVLGLFFQASMATIQHGMAARSAETAIGPDKPLVETVRIEPGAGGATFAMTRVDTDREVEFTLTGPTGKTYEFDKLKLAPTPGESAFEDGAVRSFTIRDPAPGVWKMTAKVKSGGVGGIGAGDPNIVQLLAAVRSPGTQVGVEIQARALSQYPDPIVVRAAPTYLGQPVVGAALSVIVTRPDGTRVTVALRDDGGAAAGDAVPGDGVYTALFDQYASQGNGAYAFDVRVTTGGGQAKTGDGEFGSAPGDAPAAGTVVPDLVRLSTGTVVVDNVPALPGGFVTGRVFKDANGNGRSDPGEPGVDGVLVYPDLNADGERNGSEPVAFTNADGVYQFELANPGTYVVRIETPAGEVRSTADPVAPVGGGATAAGVDFPLAVPVPSPRRFAVAADRGGAPSLSVRNALGTEVLALAAFDPAFGGGVRVAVADVTGDGVDDVVVGTGPGVPTRVRVIDGATGSELFVVDPFEATFVGGVYVAAGDLNGDGRADLVITPDEGGGPRARVFSGNGFVQLADFFGINDPNFRGGARPALGDLDGDGKADLVVAAGFGGGPRVGTFSGAKVAAEGALADQSTDRWESWKLFGDFFVFEEGLRNGAYVAAGDTTGDGRADLAAGGGPGGGPRVSVFGGAELLGGTRTRVADFFAGDVNNRGGVRVALRDLDGDARADVVTGAGAAAGSGVTAYAGASLSGDPPALFAFDAYPGFGGGVFVG